jgi:hypothetical protein
MFVIAHAGHWALSLAYLVPVLGLGVWIAVTSARDRRRDRADGRRAEPPDERS